MTETWSWAAYGEALLRAEGVPVREEETEEGEPRDAYPLHERFTQQ